MKLLWIVVGTFQMMHDRYGKVINIPLTYYLEITPAWPGSKYKTIAEPLTLINKKVLNMFSKFLEDKNLNKKKI